MDKIKNSIKNSYMHYILIVICIFGLFRNNINPHVLLIVLIVTCICAIINNHQNRILNEKIKTINKTVVLEVYGDNDFSVVTFENNYKIHEEYNKMVKEKLTKKTLIHKEDSHEEKIYLVIHEFDDVDGRFIELATNVWGDYDSMKSHDIFIVR